VASGFTLVIFYLRVKIERESRRKAGRIDARKAGRKTIILTSSRAYLESLPAGIDPAFGRRRHAAWAALELP
jgi:hypothetical protein